MRKIVVSTPMNIYTSKHLDINNAAEIKLVANGIMDRIDNGECLNMTMDDGNTVIIPNEILRKSVFFIDEVKE